jgi:outer membrane usher protein
MGMAVDDDGQPVSLLAGTATEQGREQGRKVEFFTNRTGRFAIAGAAPGQWLLEFLAGDQPLRATLTIPAGSQGIHQAGTIKAVP